MNTSRSSTETRHRGRSSDKLLFDKLKKHYTTLIYIYIDALKTLQRLLAVVHYFRKKHHLRCSTKMLLAKFRLTYQTKSNLEFDKSRREGSH